MLRPLKEGLRPSGFLCHYSYLRDYEFQLSFCQVCFRNGSSGMFSLSESMAALSNVVDFRIAAARNLPFEALVYVCAHLHTNLSPDFGIIV